MDPRSLPSAVALEDVLRRGHEALRAGYVDGALRTFDAVVEVAGWDEAFLGVETDDPEGFARDADAASWLFLCGEEFAAMMRIAASSGASFSARSR